jgi:hypothetical protein
MTTQRNEPSFIGNLFCSKPTSVDAVMDTFHKAIADLEAVESHCRSAAAEHAQAIKEREARMAAAVVEADRASTIAGKMKALFA